MLILYVIAGRAVAPFHGDESIYTAMSVDYGYILLEQDLSKVIYTDEPENPIEQSYRITDAVLMRYFIGAAWHAAGFTTDDMNAPWWWAQSFDFNVENGFYPGDELLLVSRIPAVILTGGAVLLLFLIGMQLQGRVVAYIATLYFALNPAVLLSGRRSAKEGPHLFFELFILLMAIHVINRIRHPERRGVPLWAWSVCLGVGSALGIASKLTNVFPVVAAFGAIALFTLLRARAQIVPVLVNMLMSGVLVLGVFYAVNPAYWNGPIERTWMSVQIRAEVLDGQTNNFDNSYRGDMGLRLRGFWDNVFADGPPQYYEAEEWGEYIAGQIEFYESTPLTGFNPPGVGVVMFVLMLIGYAVLLGWLRPVPLNPSAQWVIGVWGVFALVYSMLLVPLSWQRYYLPFFPVLGLTAGLGVVWVVSLYLRNAVEQSPQYKRGSARVERSAEKSQQST